MQYAFGDILLAFRRTDNTPHDAPRAQHVVFMYQDYIRSYVCYLPESRAIVSRRAVQLATTRPTAWQLVPRTFQASDNAPATQSATPTLPPNLVIPTTEFAGQNVPPTNAVTGPINNNQAERFPSIAHLIPRNFQVANPTTNATIAESTAETVLPPSTANHDIEPAPIPESTPITEAAVHSDVSTPISSVPVSDSVMHVASEPANQSMQSKAAES